MEKPEEKRNEVRVMEYRKYCAFISYRHYTPDMEIAQRLHTLIEQYTVPVDFRKDPSQKHPG